MEEMCFEEGEWDSSTFSHQDSPKEKEKNKREKEKKTRARRGTETQKGVKLGRKSTGVMRADTPLALGIAAERLKAVLEKLVELEEFGESELDAKKNEKHDHSHCQVALS